MIAEEILESAIEKAEQKGFDQYRFDSECCTTTRYINVIIFNHEFAKAFWGDGEKEEECDCLVGFGMEHKKDCTTQICPHCNQPINIRNSSGYCDHLYYPEACDICRLSFMDWKDHLKIMVLEKEPLQYIKKFLD